MSQSHISGMLDMLEQHSVYHNSLGEINLNITEEDRIRLQALAEAFQLPLEQVAAALIHSALMEVEERMPYKQGEKVIRVEDGDPIYEDVGLTPKYLSAKRKLEAKLAKARQR